MPVFPQNYTINYHKSRNFILFYRCDCVMRRKKTPYKKPLFDEFVPQLFCFHIIKMSSSESEGEQPKEIKKVKPVKRKQNISEEERARRRERMINLRKKLAEKQQSKNKNIDEIVKQKVEELQKRQTNKKVKNTHNDDDQADGDGVDGDVPVSPLKKPAKKPTRNHVPTVVVDSDDEDIPAPKRATSKKAPVTKKVSIKYYGKVDPRTIQDDAQLLEGLHRADHENKIKKSAAKKAAAAAAPDPFDEMMDDYF